MAAADFQGNMDTWRNTGTGHVQPIALWVLAHPLPCGGEANVGMRMTDRGENTL